MVIKAIYAGDLNNSECLVFTLSGDYSKFSDTNGDFNYLLETVIEDKDFIIFNYDIDSTKEISRKQLLKLIEKGD